MAQRQVGIGKRMHLDMHVQRDLRCKGEELLGIGTRQVRHGTDGAFTKGSLARPVAGEIRSMRARSNGSTSNRGRDGS